MKKNESSLMIQKAIRSACFNQLKKNMEKFKDMPMPFDMERFTYGGFEVVVDA